MRETVTQKEFFKFHTHFRQLRSEGATDAVVSVVDKNVTDGEFYKSYVWLDKGRQVEIGGFVPCRNEWFVDKTCKTAVDGAEKCFICDCIIKKKCTVNGFAYCLSCLGPKLYDSGMTVFHTAD